MNVLSNDHYGATSLVASVAQALDSAGLGEASIPWHALVPLDQFHVGGAAATQDLAQRLGVESGSRVLDVGSGLGGPARHLAASFGCGVTGIDLNAPFVELAMFLTERVGLAAKARFLVGDATDIPLASEGFDFALSQHVAMNIEDRDALYREVHRLLVPGGRFAMYDVVEGDGEAVHYPVPWSRRAATSFVLSADATRRALERAGFEIVDWRDATLDGMSWQQAQVTALQLRPEASTRLGLPLIMGPAFPEMVMNLGRNLREARLRLLQAVVRRPR